MTFADVINVAVTIYGVATACSPAFQLRRMLQTGSSDDVSIPFLLVIVCGYPLWLTYGLMLNSFPIITSNVIAIVVGVPTLLVAMHLRRRRLARRVE